MPIMARETIFRCDQCGESDDVRTVRVADGEVWEVDLCTKHREALMKIVRHGHQVNSPGIGRRDPDKTYDRLVREVE